MKNTDGSIITTTTKEIYLPARIIYQINNRALFKKRIKRLSCFDYDKEQKRWVWLYKAEAKELDFSDEYQKAPQQPIVLASCYAANQSRLHVYVRSLERIGWIVEFIDKHFSRKVLGAEYLDQYLVLTRADAVSANQVPSPEDIFRNKDTLLAEDYRKREAKLELLEKGDPQTFHNSVFKGMEEEMGDFKRNNLEMFYADGLERFKDAIKLNLMIACQRDKTGKKVSMKDIFKDYLPDL